MSKVKTNFGAKKRFAHPRTGKVKRLHTFQSQILTKKAKKRECNLNKATLVDTTTDKISVPNIVTQNTAGSKGLFFNNEKRIRSVICPLTNTAGSKGVFVINKKYQ